MSPRERLTRVKRDRVFTAALAADLLTACSRAVGVDQEYERPHIAAFCLVLLDYCGRTSERECVCRITDANREGDWATALAEAEKLAQIV